MFRIDHRQAECAAFRHAGEAVAAAELAVPFRSVESSRVVWSVPAPTSEAERLDRQKAAMLVWLAGQIAERSSGPVTSAALVDGGCCAQHRRRRGE